MYPVLTKQISTFETNAGKFYLFKIGYNETFRINGEDIKGAIELQFDEIPTVEKVYEKKVLKHYSSNSEVISPEEFQEKKLKLLDSLSHNNDPEYGLTFKYIDDRHRYEKFIETYKPNYETVVTVKDVKLKIVSFKKSEYKDIDTFYSLGEKADYSKSLSKLVFSQKSSFIEIASEIGLVRSEEKDCKGMKYYIPDHSNLRFAKINGRYISGPERDYSFIGTYEECVEKRRIWRNDLKNLIMNHVGKLRAENQFLTDDSTLLNELDLIEDNLYKIQSKVKTANEKTRCLNRIRKLKKDILKRYI